MPLKRSDRGTWTTRDLVTCGHWTCPSCGPYMARKIAGTIGACMERWLGGGDGQQANENTLDVWMLTLTAPHKLGDDTRTFVAQLYEATAYLFRSRTWQRFEEEWGIRARIRVLDVTFGGPNGTHPHFHVALFLDGAPGGFRHWSRKRRGEYVSDLQNVPAMYTDLSLLQVWRAGVEKAGIVIEDDAAFADFAVKVSPSEEASSYFTKWALADEVGGTALKRDNHLTLLDKCGAGDDAAGATYIEWRRACGGRQWITGLEDTRTLVGVTDDDVAAFVAAQLAKRDEEKAPVLVAPLALVVRAYLWPRALQLGLPTVLREIERAEFAGEDLQRALDRFLWAVSLRSNPPRNDGESSS